MTRIGLVPRMLALSVSALSPCVVPKRILASQMPDQGSALPQPYPARAPAQLAVLLAGLADRYASPAIGGREFAALSGVLQAAHSANRAARHQQPVQPGVPEEEP